MIDSEALPLDDPHEVREDEASARVEGVVADHSTNADLSEPSLGGGNTA